MKQTADQQQIFELVYQWVLTESLEEEKSKMELMQSCQQSIDVLRDFVQDSELSKDITLIENILPEIVNSIVKNN